MAVNEAITAHTSLRTPSEAMRRWAAVAKARPHVLLLARWPVGVVRTQIRTLYSGLHALGFTFTFVGPNDPSLVSLQHSFEGMAGLEFVAAPLESKCCRLWPVVRSLLRTGRFGVIHSHGTTAAVHASLANLGLGIPHLASLYDPLHANQFPGWLGRLKHWTLTQALQKADGITTAGPAETANLLEHLPSLKDYANRIVTLPGVIASEEFGLRSEYRTEDVRERLGVDRGATLVGSLGYTLIEKEFAALLDALDLLRWQAATTPFHVVYYGSGDHRQAQQNILRRGLEKHLSLVDVATVSRSVLREFDLLVLVSCSSASKLVALEAMAHGISVLATDAPAMRELLQDTPTRWVRGNDAEALAEALRRAITRPWPEEARAFAVAARERFDRRHAVIRMSELLESLSARAKHEAKAA